MERREPSDQPPASLAAGLPTPASGHSPSAAHAPVAHGEETSPSSGAWHVELLEGGPGLLDDIHDDWSALCARSAETPWYVRPEWVRCYLDHFAPPQGVRLVTARRGGELHAVVPLVANRQRACGLPARRLRSAADNEAWRFDLARSPGEPGAAALPAIMRQLPHLRGWDFLELRDVAEGGGAEELARSAAAEGCAVSRLESMRTPRLALGDWDGDPEYFIKRGSTKFRSNMRRAIREAGSDLRLERMETFDPDAFERFLALEASGWKGEAGSALRTDARACAFHRALFEMIAAAGDFAMKFLWVGENLVGAACAIEHRGYHVVLKGARDDSYRKLSPGHLLVHALLLDCAERGMSVFDFAGLDEQWKLAWAPDLLRHHTHFIFRRGLYGRALHAAMFRLSPALKRLRAGSAGS